VGLFAAGFLVMLTITGIALQHPASFGLDRRYVQSEILLSWYGVELEGAKTTYQLRGKYLVLADGEVYWDNRRLLQLETLTGAALSGNTLVFTDTFYYYLFDATTAEPIEQIGAPATISQSGSIGGDFVFRSQTSWYRFIEAEAEFVVIPAMNAQDFRQPIAAPAAVQSQLRRVQAASIVSWQQFFSDLHTGRLFGTLGPLLIDLVGLAVLLLAGTGLWNWTARHRG
jgi:hypothetical protein